MTDAAPHTGIPLNPDDPDGDCPEVSAWFDIDHLPGMPGLRPELLASQPWQQLRTPLASRTPVMGRDEVNYRPSTSAEVRCGTCSMFLPEGRCSLVEGSIAAGAVCDRWEPRQPLLVSPDKSADTAPHKGPLEHRVHDYLRAHYPEDTTEWVCRSAWEKNKVPLDRIAYARRPGGRDQAKVDDMVSKLDDGWKPDRVVLIDQGTAGKMVVADGYHRLLALDKAGEKDVRAYVGTPRPGAGNWKADVLAMQREVLNRSGDEDEGGS